MRELSGEASVIEWSRLLWTTKCADVSIQKAPLPSQEQLHWRGVSGSLCERRWEVRKERRALLRGQKEVPCCSWAWGLVHLHCCGFRCVSGKVFPSGYKQSLFLIGPETPLWPVANRVLLQRERISLLTDGMQ